MTDAVAFATYVNHELNNKHRECIKPELHQDYRPLCSLSNPVTTWLFGDDLLKQVKDMTEVNKVGQRVAPSRFYVTQPAQEKRENEICDATSVTVSNPSFLSLSHVCTDKIAGRLKHFLPEWAKLTSDNIVLDCAAHYHIDFIY